MFSIIIKYSFSLLKRFTLFAVFLGFIPLLLTAYQYPLKTVESISYSILLQSAPWFLWCTQMIFTGIGYSLKKHKHIYVVFITSIFTTILIYASIQNLSLQKHDILKTSAQPILPSKSYVATKQGLLIQHTDKLNTHHKLFAQPSTKAIWIDSGNYIFQTVQTNKDKLLLSNGKKFNHQGYNTISNTVSIFIKPVQPDTSEIKIGKQLVQTWINTVYDFNQNLKKHKKYSFVEPIENSMMSLTSIKPKPISIKSPFPIEFNKTTTKANTASKNKTTTKANTASKNKTTTKANTASKNKTTAKANTASKNKTTTKANTASKNKTTAKANTASKNKTTAKANTASKNKTTAKANTASKNKTTAKANTASKNKTATKANTASKANIPVQSKKNNSNNKKIFGIPVTTLNSILTIWCIVMSGILMGILISLENNVFSSLALTLLAVIYGSVFSTKIIVYLESLLKYTPQIPPSAIPPVVLIILSTLCILLSLIKSQKKINRTHL
ncbi:MAG: hypothetical protein ACRCTQ_04445 [Brevinemataceae bacterium]